MIDWMIFWDQLSHYVKVVGTWGFIALLVLAAISFILRNRKWVIDCLIIAAVLYIFAMIMARHGFEFIDFSVIGDLFEDVFNNSE